MTEEYRKLSNYSNYRIYPDGRVYSEFINRFIKATRASDGYLANTLVDDFGRRKTIKNHILVASAFLPKLDEQTEVNHKNLNRSDNRVENLEWCTRSYNVKYSYDYRNDVRAELTSPLRKEQVLLIPELLENGFSIKLISKLYRVAHITIRNIIRGDTWKKMQPLLKFPKECYNRGTIEISRTLYNKLLKLNVDNTVLNSRVKVLESV